MTHAFHKSWLVLCGFALLACTPAAGMMTSRAAKDTIAAEHTPVARPAHSSGSNTTPEERRSCEQRRDEALLGALEKDASHDSATPARFDEYEPAVRVAQGHLADGDVASALAAALAAIEAQPDRPEGHVYAALGYYRLNALDAAEDHLQRAAAAPDRLGTVVDELRAAVADKRILLLHEQYAARAEILDRQVEAAEWLTNAWRLFPTRHDIALRAAENWDDARSCGRARTIFAFLRDHGGTPDLREHAASRFSELGDCRADREASRVDFFTCPPGALLRNGRCGCSPMVPVWNPKASRCEACSDHRVFNGHACVCPAAMVERDGACECPDPSMPLWSSRRGACVPCGTDSMWDDCACVCPEGTVWTGERCACANDALVWSADASRCVNRSHCDIGSICGCVGGQLWDGSACLCPREMPHWTEAGCTSAR